MVMKADRFPMPNLTETVFGLHGIKYFTSLDLVRGYYQMPLDKDCRDFTAFSTVDGQFRFKSMSFGLKTAPAGFQREMQRIMKGLAKVVIFLDDVLLVSDSLEEHLEIIEKVLQRLQEAGMKIKISKCKWIQKEVQFLGHIVGRNGLRKMPEYVNKVDTFTKPRTISDLRGFLGFVNYPTKVYSKLFWYNGTA